MSKTKCECGLVTEVYKIIGNFNQDGWLRNVYEAKQPVYYCGNCGKPFDDKPLTESESTTFGIIRQSSEGE